MDYDNGVAVLGAWRQSLDAGNGREGAVFLWAEDPDACQAAPCSANATCQAELFQAVCQCDQGYELDAQDRFLCIDVDECASEVKRNKFSDLTTSYYLISKRKERAGIFRQ